MNRPTPPQLRSALFVPAHRSDYLTTALASGADGLILDLEDSVTASTREAARTQVHALMSRRPAIEFPAVCVRVNALALGALDRDLDAAVGPGLLAVVVPKVADAADVTFVADALERAEVSAGLPPGSIHIWPLLETAGAIQASAQIAASSPRIAYLGGGASDGGDLEASLGFRWTCDGLATLYLRSKILVDARAAGVPHPVTGVVTDLSDPEAVRRFAEQSRDLGYEGLMVIHPRHVAIANAAFGTTAAQRSKARGTIAALETAERAGHGAVAENGQMIDAAMRASAEALLRRRPSGPPDPL